MIENYLWDNDDDPALTNIDTDNAIGQLPAPSMVYVDDNWATVALGVDPDGARLGHCHGC